MSQIIDKPKKTPMTLNEMHRELAAKEGPEFWRSLEEMTEKPGFKQAVTDEFPQTEAFWKKPVERRDFLKVMGSMIMLAGLTACGRQPLEKIVPYVKGPEDVIPGRPLYFATAMPFSGGARPLLAESHMGRPTRLEGNPQHPASTGAADVFSQASILSLTDPDRSRVVLSKNMNSGWRAFLADWNSTGMRIPEYTGNDFGILVDELLSPTLAGQLDQVLERYPDARLYHSDTLGRQSVHEGIKYACGAESDVRYDLSKAKVIAALDSDFLTNEPGSLIYARDFTGKRRVMDKKADMNRLYVVEPSPTLTGSMADHRFICDASGIGKTLRTIAAYLGVAIADPARNILDDAGKVYEEIAKDLLNHKGESLVAVGPHCSKEMHALCFAVNEKLGNNNVTALYQPPPMQAHRNKMRSIEEFAKDLESKSLVKVLMLGGNPVYNTSPSLNIAKHLAVTSMTIRLGMVANETSQICDWHLPESHFLEGWSDAVCFDGTTSIVQPLIAPLYSTKTVHEMLSLILDKKPLSSHELVMAHWKKTLARDDFDKYWQQSLHDGWLKDLALPASYPKALDNLAYPSTSLPSTAGPSTNPDPTAQPGSTQPKGDYELVIRPDSNVWDGRFANNGWLQELPRPITKLVWDNALLVSPALAAKESLSNADIVEVTVGDRHLAAPVWITPGQSKHTMTLHLGYGRSYAGQVGNRIGVNATHLMRFTGDWNIEGVKLTRTNRKFDLVSTQTHHSMHGRHFVRESSVEAFAHHPEFAKHMEHNPTKDETLYPDELKKGKYSWGMSIDLNVCTGCNACVIGCQSENNIPIVGKDEIAIGREMSWIRVDRYFEGPPDDPEIHHQPVTCMHCEYAPCEPVCPVEATNHSEDGLNQMVYNRCVGTRYCANNCPYKVRRFNFFNYSDQMNPEMELVMNPDVSVRSRGVMEKCTYCVQRINQVRIEADKEGKDVEDGQILTACQSACPAGAITFGDMKNPGSEVSRAKASPLNYGILTELNTRPHTTYGAKLKNPNPSIKGPEGLKKGTLNHG